jgi:hypothetical protein
MVDKMKETECNNRILCAVNEGMQKFGTNKLKISVTCPAVRYTYIHTLVTYFCARKRSEVQECGLVFVNESEAF